MLSAPTLALLLAAQSATPAPAPPSAEKSIEVAAKAFAECIKTKVMTAATNGAADAGAGEVWARCDTERAALDKVVEAQIAAAPADQQATAREQYRAGMEEARKGVAEGLRARAAAPTPAPSPTPGK